MKKKITNGTKSLPKVKPSCAKGSSLAAPTVRYCFS